MFGASKTSVCRILQEFCKEVWQNLSEEYFPSNIINETKIMECVNGFNQIVFSQCFRAISTYIFHNLGTKRDFISIFELFLCFFFFF